MLKEWVFLYFRHCIFRFDIRELSPFNYKWSKGGNAVYITLILWRLKYKIWWASLQKFNISENISKISVYWGYFCRKKNNLKTSNVCRIILLFIRIPLLGYSPNKTEILSKGALNTITLNPPPLKLFWQDLEVLKVLDTSKWFPYNSIFLWIDETKFSQTSLYNHLELPVISCQWPVYNPFVVFMCYVSSSKWWLHYYSQQPLVYPIVSCLPVS